MDTSPRVIACASQQEEFHLHIFQKISDFSCTGEKQSNLRRSDENVLKHQSNIIEIQFVISSLLSSALL